MCRKFDGRSPARWTRCCVLTVAVRAGEDPLAVALREAKAALGHPHSFRLLDAEGQLQHALVGGNYIAWTLPHTVKSGFPHNPPSGPTADGKPAGRLSIPPPAIRKFPSSDCSVTGYQSAGIPVENCKATREVLPLLGGNVSEGHAASKSQALAQGSKGGSCPCCRVATHIAIPATYAWGEYSSLKAQGKELWQRLGPRGGPSTCCRFKSLAVWPVDIFVKLGCS